MPITLGPVTLPDHLLWTDEHLWSPVQQTTARRLDGSLVAFALATPAGRPITLEARADAWLTRAEAEAVQALARQVGAVFLLARQGVIYSVLFRHTDPPAVALSPLIDWSAPDPADPCVGQIKLMTI